MIDTNRLILRKFTDSDLDAYYQIMKEKSVCQWLGKGGQRTKEHVLKTIEYYKKHWIQYGIGNFAVYLKDKNELIGHCGFNYIDELGGFELLYALSEDHWYKGYASEASIACLEWLEKQGSLSKVYALSYPDNHRSIHVIEKLNFIYIGNKHLFGVDLRAFELNFQSRH